MFSPWPLLTEVGDSWCNSRCGEESPHKRWQYPHEDRFLVNGMGLLLGCLQLDDESGRRVWEDVHGEANLAMRFRLHQAVVNPFIANATAWIFFFPFFCFLFFVLPVYSKITGWILLLFCFLGFAYSKRANRISLASLKKFLPRLSHGMLWLCLWGLQFFFVVIYSDSNSRDPDGFWCTL